MPRKKPIPSALKPAPAPAPTSIKTKRPKGGSRRGGARGEATPGKGGLLTVHHPEDASPKEGAAERRAVLKWRAMELKVQGRTLRQISLQLQEDFELAEAPSHAAVDDWLDEAFAETMTAKQTDADRHCSVILIRGEALISNLLPTALGNTIIRRTRIRDGQEIEILDERAFEEQLKATAEIRKLMDQQAKLLKIGRVGEGKDADGNTQINGQSLTLLVEKTVTNHIIFPGQAPMKEVRAALVLSSGDPDIDALDAEAIDIPGPAPI